MIDDLDAGGAQRQLALLTRLLSRRGCNIDILAYRAPRFFDSSVDAVGVGVTRLRAVGRLRRAGSVRRSIAARGPDVVMAFLAGPAAYAELAKLGTIRFKLIVAEFTAPHGAVRTTQRLRLAGHHLADAVVTETRHNARLFASAAPWLASRIRVIRNGVDPNAVAPRQVEHDAPSGESDSPVTRVLVLAAYRLQKNPFGLLEAVARVHAAAPHARFVVEWYGPTYAVYGNDSVYRELRHMVRSRGLGTIFQLHPAAPDPRRLYERASVVCLPSLYEGCSNVICEAAASGVPLIVSDTGDNAEFVEHERSGFLVDPTDPADIASTLLRFHHLQPDVRLKMGLRGAELAQGLFDPERFGNDYRKLIDDVLHQDHGFGCTGRTDKVDSPDPARSSRQTERSEDEGRA